MAEHEHGCPLCAQPISAATFDEIADAMDESIFKHLVELSMRRSERSGRPIKPSVDGERATLSMMVTPKIKERLDHAAQHNGRTRSQEAEQRIEWSFDRADLLPEVLRLAYGEDVAAVLAILGLVMSVRGRQPETLPVALKEAFAVLGALSAATEQNADGMRRLLRLGNVQRLIDGPEGEPVRKLLERQRRFRTSRREQRKHAAPAKSGATD